MQDLLNERGLDTANATVDRAIEEFETAIRWMRDNASTLFPGGLYIAFANPYEFTDATGDLSACPAAEILGFDGSVPELRPAYIRISEAYMRIAVETQSDMIMMLEHFCGHGFHSEDPDSPCYRGPNNENWFDGTCIHPNPTGHQVISDLFTRLFRP